MRLLLAADPLRPREPDPAFGAEIEAIERLGIAFDVLDFEALIADRIDDAVRRVTAADLGLVVYRGWMLPVDRYEAIAAAIETRGGLLINDAAGYAAAHYLPGSYAALEGMTPRTTWVPGRAPFDPAQIAAAVAEFGDRPIVVKDFVKSRKHEWADACFVASAADRAEVNRVVGNFVERQGEDLAGGLVFREYVELERVGTHPTSGLALGMEFRLYILDGALLASGRYWDEVEYSGSVPTDQFVELARSLPSRFLAMDVARTSAGMWIVIEVGDAQVSGLPASIDPLRFYGSLRDRLT